MKNEVLFWMAILPSCKVSIIGLVVELEIHMPLNWSDTWKVIIDHYSQKQFTFSPTNIS
jgi:hypothetical protein